MSKIVNTSFITDYSGEPPTVTYSNPVTTVVIRQIPPARIITRIYCCQSCNRRCRNCCCDNQCGCNSCGCNRCGCNQCCGNRCCNNC